VMVCFVCVWTVGGQVCFFAIKTDRERERGLLVYFFTVSLFLIEILALFTYTHRSCILLRRRRRSQMEETRSTR
jgi:hypothetical protein